MKRSRLAVRAAWLCCLAFCVGTATGCGGGTPARVGAGGASGSGADLAGGGGGGGGGGDAGASAGASPSDDAGVDVAGASVADAAAPDAGPSADASPTPFVCNQLTGLYTSGQWFDAGFEMDGLDGTRWQSKVQKYAYVEKWADPKNGIWNQAIKSACANASDAPDRIVFVIFSPDTKPDEPTMEMLINDVIATLKLKVPSAKEIDLLTMSRAPGNVMCSNNNDTWTVVGAYVDQAIQAVASASSGFIKVGPQYFVPDCKTSYSVANDTDLTQSAATAIAQMIAPYYVAHP
jgi:hypothetical protein